MTTAGQSPTVRSRRLRAELRRLREERGLTIASVASDLDWSASQLSRIEGGQRRAHPNDVRVLLDVYDVTGDEREALIQLARDARKRGWWQAYGNAIPPWAETYVGLEAEATVIRNYESELVPGLLQTPDYYRAFILTAPAAATEAEISQRINVRATRQDRLTKSENPPRFWAVINEAVIRRVVGNAATMRAQLEHMAEIARLDNVTLQVMPFAGGAHAAMGASFHILEFPEPTDQGVVYVEQPTSSLYLESSEEIARYTLMFDHLRAASLPPRDSAKMIINAIKDLA